MTDRLAVIASVAVAALRDDSQAHDHVAERRAALRSALMRIVALAQASGAGGTPERRPSETCTLVWRGQEITVTASWRPGTRSVIDVTARGWRAGTDLQCLADDASSLISAALQCGLSVGELRRLTVTAPVVGDGEVVDEPVSVIGAILQALDGLEVSL